MPGATSDDIAQANKVFLPLLGVSFKEVSVKKAKAKAPPPKKHKPSKPLNDNKPKKRAARHNRY
jgi:hypothetical protein